MEKIILASSSYARQQLMERLKCPFTCFSPEADESRLPNESPEDMCTRLAKLKAMTAAQTFLGSICIGSDEVACLNGKILGKPMNHQKAVEQLTLCSNQRVEFITGLYIWDGRHHRGYDALVRSMVVFKPLSRIQIEEYLEKEKPYTSAGSFHSEGLGPYLMVRFEGEDPTALMGLPLIKVCEIFKEIGLMP